MATSALKIILSAIEFGKPGQAKSVEREFAILMRISHFRRDFYKNQVLKTLLEI